MDIKIAPEVLYSSIYLRGRHALKFLWEYKQLVEIEWLLLNKFNDKLNKFCFVCLDIQLKLNGNLMNMKVARLFQSIVKSENK